MGIFSKIKTLLNREKSIENIKELEAEFQKLLVDVNAKLISIAGIRGSYAAIPILFSSEPEFEVKKFINHFIKWLILQGDLQEEIFMENFDELWLKVKKQVIFCILLTNTLVFIAYLNDERDFKKLNNWLSKNLDRMKKLFRL